MDTYWTTQCVNKPGETLLCFGKSIRARFVDQEEADLAAQALNELIGGAVFVPTEGYLVEIDENAGALVGAER